MVVGGGVTGGSEPVYSRWLFTEFALLTTPVVSASRSAVPTAPGSAVGCVCRYRAAAPAVCGDAIDVPFHVAVPPFCHADVMLTPGANQSTQVPQLENDARVSVLVLAPIVSAFGALA